MRKDGSCRAMSKKKQVANMCERVGNVGVEIMKSGKGQLLCIIAMM